MPKILNMKGKVFGRLLAKTMSAERKDGRILWICQCECGNEIKVAASYLKNGNTSSCGCLAKEKLIERNRLNSKHKLSDHPLYSVWRQMKSRCINKKSHNYKWYGGRGIKVCNRWENDPENFIRWAEKHGWKKGLEIDRINNNGDYRPDNCRFVTHRKNSENKNNINSYGVGIRKIGNKYIARTTIDEKEIHIGCYSSLKKCRIKRKEFIKERLNL